MEGVRGSHGRQGTPAAGGPGDHAQGEFAQDTPSAPKEGTTCLNPPAVPRSGAPAARGACAPCEEIRVRVRTCHGHLHTRVCVWVFTRVLACVTCVRTCLRGCRALWQRSSPLREGQSPDSWRMCPKRRHAPPRPPPRGACLPSMARTTQTRPALPGHEESKQHWPKGRLWAPRA